MPEEPIAVVVAGCEASRHSAVVATLLDRAGVLSEPPPGGYVAVQHHRRGRPPAVPTHRGCGGRPPRRVDVTVSHPLLRYLSLVEAPPVNRLSGAGIEVLAHVSTQGGAVVYVVPAGAPLTPPEVSALDELVNAGVQVFFVLTADPAGRWPRPPLRGRRPRPPDPQAPATAAVAVHRSQVAAAVPALADSPWYAVDPPAADVAQLRRTLIDWACAEALRRAADVPPTAPRGLAVPRTAVASDWRARSAALHRTGRYAVSQHLTIDLAGVHLRILSRLAPDGDAVTVLKLLDEELHALSLRADAETERAVQVLLDGVLRAVFGTPPPPDAQLWLAKAANRRLPADTVGGALIVTADGAVVWVPGADVVAALRPCHLPEPPTVLPGLGMALAGQCWASAEWNDPRRLPTSVRRSLRALEEAMLRRVAHRLDEVRRQVNQLVDDAVRGGVTGS